VKKKNNHVLITGNAGFIGRHFEAYHKAQGDVVVGLDIKNGKDCRDYFRIVKAKFDLVIHCAAIVGGRETIENEPLAVATDLSIDAEMFNWAVKTGQPRVVYFSSSAAYPIVYQKYIPVMHDWRLHEGDIELDCIQNPDMTYGWAKLTGEYLAQFARQKGVAVHVFRPFSGYGEDQDLCYPFPALAKKVKENPESVEVWGNGTQVRDFIHVDDIVGAVSTAVKLGIEGPVNLCSGVGTSFNWLAATMGAKNIVHRTDKPVGVMYRVGDNKKLSAFYTPKVSLEEGIGRMMNVVRP
jgi:nucleoside-diphosphate-sugar epimerase